MCQYSANDGCANDWHLMHLMQLAISNAGLILIEATATERHGRISHGCLGLYNDASEAALARVMAAARNVAPPGTCWGIQINHAGRKASTQRPWEGRGALGPTEDPWQTEGPSPECAMPGWHTPTEMTQGDMGRVRDSFVAAALRAARLGFNVVELHAAHGYLIHQFLSPLANHREDCYGGSLENRMRFPLKIAAGVRNALPPSVAMGLRITGSDWSPDGIDITEATVFASALKSLGADYICVSSGGIASVRIPVGPNYQVPFAATVKANVNLPTQAVGMIADPQQAEAIIASGQADMVTLARAILDNPRWVWHAAEKLNAMEGLTYPPQYERSKATLWPGARLARPHNASADD
jgi:2,4-dienoyl-CoA reductase-like NADH-dependent reductase (Old Yellow Enzyme family)